MSTTPPAGPPPPSRAQIADIIKRYIKEDRTPNWATDMPIFYRDLWPKYPSLAFWTHHEMPYRLNTMLHFKTIEGAAKLASDYAVFNYTPSTVDTSPQPSYTTGDRGTDGPTPPVLAPKPRTIAQFIRSTTTQQPS